jgi:Na+/H+ antiporter NhaC
MYSCTGPSSRVALSALGALLLLAPGATPLSGQGATADLSVGVDGPSVLLRGVPFNLTIRLEDRVDARFQVLTADGRELAAGELPSREDVQIRDLEVGDRAELPLRIAVAGATGGSGEGSYDPPIFPGWISLLPPLVAIALALIFREVVISLFLGVWIGAFFVAGLNPLNAFWRSIDTFITPSVANSGNASILIFSALLGGMVGVIGRCGGSRGIVAAVRPLATSPRRAQLATFLAGLAIFFDDYANTLIVGNTFRPITDKLRISREKLAYIVDSTAAPVVTIVFVSTWVGFEISRIQDGLRIASQQTSDPALAASLANASPFTVFLETIPYLFYPILALAMVGLIVFTRRDFGPMHGAESRARSGGGVYREGAQLMVDTESGGLDAKEGAPHRWYNAAIPIFTVVIVVVLGLYYDGRANAGDGSLWDIFGAADPFKTLLWGSLAGAIVAMTLSVTQRILTLRESIEGLLAGARAMMVAFAILILAWSLGLVTEEVGTARYLTQILSDNLDPRLLPALVFITAAAISFATGTSWATMAILLPLVVPLMVAMGGASPAAGGLSSTLLLGTVSAVLAGAIFGDHCSPISDTTVLSSMASACDHMDHVRTQLPYALTVAVTALLAGYLATAFGLHPAISYALGIAGLYLTLRFLGRRSGDPVRSAPLSEEDPE